MREDDQLRLLPVEFRDLSCQLMVCVVAALAVALAIFGGATALGQSIAFGALALGAVLLLLGLFTRQLQPRKTFAYWPIAGFILFAGWQRLPQSVSVVAAVSGQSVPIRNSLLTAAAQPSANEQTISFYPFAAMVDLRTVLCATAAFVIVLHAGFDRRRLPQILFALVCLGLVAALFSLGQAATGAETIYGLVPRGQANSGPFMNHSHFAQYMNLSIGAALALLLMQVHSLIEAGGDNWQRFRQNLVGPAKSIVIFCIVVIVLGALSVAACLSRGGMVGFLTAAAVVAITLILSKRSSGTSTLIGALATLIVTAVLVAGVEPAINYFSTLRHLQDVEHGRWEIVKDCIAIWKKMPLVGTGLGTFQFVFPMFDTSNVPRYATHAENEYAQLLCETGAVGFGLLIVLLGFSGWKLIYLLRRRRDMLQGCGQGLMFGLIAVLVHSASDFGQHAPANAILAASELALLVNAADLARARSAARKRAASTVVSTGIFTRLMGLTPVAALVSAMLWILPSAINAAKAEPVWADFTRAQKALLADEPIPRRTLETLKKTTAWLVDRQPDNVEAVFWNNLLAWRTLPQKASDDGKQIMLNRQSVEGLIQSFAASTEFCPTYSPNFWMAGQLQYRILYQSHGVDLIRFAYNLAQNNSAIAIDLADIDMKADRVSQAIDELKRAVANEPGAAARAIDICLTRQDLDSLAYSLAHDDSSQLLRLAKKLRDAKRNPELGARAQEKGMAKLREKVNSAVVGDDSIDSLVTLAELYVADRKVDDAIALYRRASNTQYSRTDLHLRLGHLLLSSNQLDSARHEGEICLRLQPGMDEAKALIDEAMVASVRTQPAR